MPRWWIKAAIQRGISLLPARTHWNEWFQEHATRSLECTAGRFESQLKKCPDASGILPRVHLRQSVRAAKGA